MKEISEPGAEVSVLMTRVARSVYVQTGGRQRPEQLTDMTREFSFHKAAPKRQFADGKQCAINIDFPQNVFSVGDDLSFSVSSSCSCEIGLVDFTDQKGETAVILPGTPAHYFLTGGEPLEPNVPLQIPSSKRPKIQPPVRWSRSS